MRGEATIRVTSTIIIVRVIIIRKYGQDTNLEVNEESGLNEK